MMIFDLVITKDDYVIASANQGQVYMWNLSKVLENQLSPDSVQSSPSIYKPIHKFSISDKTYYSMSLINDSLLNIVSAQTIKFYNPTKLVQKQETVAFEYQILSEDIQNTFQDYFNVTCSYNQNKLLIGSAAGKVLLFDVFKQKYQNSTNLQLPFSSSLVKQYSKLSISAIKQFNNQVVVGTKSGTISSYDVRNFQKIGQFSLNNVELPPVKAITNNDKFIYVGHNDSVSRWDHSRRYVGCYQTNFECSSLLKTDEQLLVAGNSPNVYRFGLSNIKQWNSSSKCLLSLKIKDDFVLSCGIGKFVDVYNGAERICSLVAI